MFHIQISVLFKSSDITAGLKNLLSNSVKPTRLWAEIAGTVPPSTEKRESHLFLSREAIYSSLSELAQLWHLRDNTGDPNVVFRH